QLPEAAGGDLADTGNRRHRQRRDERLLHGGGDDVKPIGLAPFAGDLREELGAGDSRRNGYADIPGDPLANRHGHAGGAALAAAAGADVQVGFVEGQGFDLVAVVVEDGAHSPCGLPVLLEAVGDDDEVGA